MIGPAPRPHALGSGGAPSIYCRNGWADVHLGWSCDGHCDAYSVSELRIFVSENLADGRIRVLYEASILGMASWNSQCRTGIFRVIDNVVQGMAASGECALTACVWTEVDFIKPTRKHLDSSARTTGIPLLPEILLVDEVIAVGDAAFQKKCLGKMGDVAHQGRTVLFVSHNIGAIKRLCGRALWLDAGSLCKHGRTGVVVREYLSQNLEESAERVWVGDNRPGDDRVRLCRVRIYQPPSVPCARIDITQPFDIEIETEVLCQLPEIAVSFMVSDAEGTTLFHSADLFCGKSEGVPGRRISRCTLPPFTFNSGTYLLTVASDIPMGDRLMFFEEAVLQWEVEPVCPKMGRYPAESGKGASGQDWGRGV